MSSELQVWNFALVNPANGWQGYNIRQVIYPSVLVAAKGTDIVVQFQFGAGSNGTLDSVYIGYQDPAVNEWDFDGSQVPLTFGGASSVAVVDPGNLTFKSDIIPFAWDSTGNKVPMLALHMSGAVINGRADTGGPGSHMFYSGGPDTGSETSPSGTWVNWGGYLFSTPAAYITPIQDVLGQGIASIDAVGAPQIAGGALQGLALVPIGIAGAEALGDPALAGGRITSATGGCLLPLPTPPPPPEDRALDHILHGLVVCTTGLPGNLVLPRWQTPAPKMPECDVDWCGIGVIRETPEFNGAIIHWPRNADNPDGFDEYQRSVEIEVMASFYGPNARGNSNRFRDGLFIAQNREDLFRNGLALADTNMPGVFAPELINNKWFQRIDSTFAVRLFIDRFYAVLNLLRAVGTIHGEKFSEDFDSGLTPPQRPK
jgi:hypothetical protein